MGASLFYALLTVGQAKMGLKMGLKTPLLNTLVWRVPVDLQLVPVDQNLANTIASNVRVDIRSIQCVNCLTRASYGHDRGVVPSSKLAHFF